MRWHPHLGGRVTYFDQKLLSHYQHVAPAARLTDSRLRQVARWEALAAEGNDLAVEALERWRAAGGTYDDATYGPVIRWYLQALRELEFTQGHTARD